MDNIVTLQNSTVKQMPKYALLAAKLREDILGGKFKLGERVPSQGRLVSKHKVALTTVRQAVEVLQHEGLLESVHGKGVYVRSTEASQGKLGAVPYEHTIGFLFVGSSVENALNHIMQLNVQKYSRNSGVCVSFDAYFGDQAGEEEHISRWSKGLSAVIMVGLIDEKLLALLRKNVRHIVIIGGTVSPVEGKDISRVSFNYESAMSLAVSYLAALGHKRILGAARRDIMLSVLYEAFGDSLKAAAQNANVCADVRGYNANDTVALANEIANMSERPTAIICNGSQKAYELMTQLIMAGIKVPEQISIIAIGESELVRGFAPRLTCIGNFTEIGVLAFEAAVRAIKSNACIFQDIAGILKPGDTCVPVGLMCHESAC